MSQISKIASALSKADVGVLSMASLSPTGQRLYQWREAGTLRTNLVCLSNLSHMLADKSQRDTIQSAFLTNKTTPSELSKHLYKQPVDTKMTLGEIQDFIVPEREAVWNKNYGTALTANAPPTTSVFGKNHAASIKFHDPKSPIQKFYEDFGITSAASVLAHTQSPDQTESRTGSGTKLSTKPAPSEGDVKGLVDKLEVKILERLDKATVVE